jgi:hypothetical protein
MTGVLANPLLQRMTAFLASLGSGSSYFGLNV